MMVGMGNLSLNYDAHYVKTPVWLIIKKNSKFQQRLKFCVWAFNVVGFM